MPRCTFCKTNYEFPRGVTVVQRDGTAKHFCSSKCRKNSTMGRDNKRTKWVTKNAASQETEKIEKKE